MAQGVEAERYFLTVGARQAHYQRAGSGPPIVLLHAPCYSSRAVMPVLEFLAREFTVLALDLPGYGSSDPIEVDSPSVSDYAIAVSEILDALGVERFVIYGIESAAIIALELASMEPNRVLAAILHSLPIYTETERHELYSSGFPTFLPEPDGAHLIRLWSWCRDRYVYYPWFKRETAARLQRDIPAPGQLHADAMDILRAGDRYAMAMLAGLEYNVRRSITQLDVPAAIVTQENDRFREHLSRLPKLPVRHRASILPASYSDLVEYVGNFVRSCVSDLPTEPDPPPRVLLVAGGETKAYVKTAHGRLFTRQFLNASGRPLVMLHPSPSSTAMLDKPMRLLARNRPVLAFDTLGNGESDKPRVDEPSIPFYASVILDALDRLAVADFDLYGTHTGALIAVEIALAQPERVGRLIVEGIGLYTEDERQTILAKYMPDLTPRWDGAHLISAWNYLLYQTLFWPWFEQTRAAMRSIKPISTRGLHRWVVELLKSGETYPLAYRAAFRYRAEERLPKLETRTLFASHADDLFFGHIGVLAGLSRRGRPCELPERFDDRIAVFARFLDGGDG